MSRFGYKVSGFANRRRVERSMKLVGHVQMLTARTVGRGTVRLEQPKVVPNTLQRRTNTYGIVKGTRRFGRPSVVRQMCKPSLIDLNPVMGTRRKAGFTGHRERLSERASLTVKDDAIVRSLREMNRKRSPEMSDPTLVTYCYSE